MSAAASLHRIAFPGLSRGQLHEIHACEEDWAAAIAFGLVAIGANDRGSIVLARVSCRGGHHAWPYGEGLVELGIDPARLLIVETRDERELLRVGLDAARSAALTMVLLETWGGLPAYDLTASRRFVLAAERSSVGIVMLRGSAPPRNSAAHTRWLIRSVPSTGLAARVPGLPTLDAELLRKRGAPAGICWRLEWDADHGIFRESPAYVETIAPLSGSVAAVAGLRTGQIRSWAA